MCKKYLKSVSILQRDPICIYRGQAKNKKKKQKQKLDLENVCLPFDTIGVFSKCKTLQMQLAFHFLVGKKKPHKQD